MRWRSGPAPRTDVTTGAPSRRSRRLGELGKTLGQGVSLLAEHGDPDEVVGDGRHVRLSVGAPVHLDVVSPRAYAVVLAEPVAAERARVGRSSDASAPGGEAAAGRVVAVETEGAARRRVQPVGGDDPGRGECRPVAARVVGAHGHARVVLRHLGRAEREHLDAGGDHGLGQGGVQGGAPDAASRTGREVGLGDAAPGDVADAAEVVSGRVDPEAGEGLEATGHQALAAGLVDRARPRLEDDGRQTRADGIQRRGEADRAAADDDDVDAHGVAPVGAPAGEAISRKASFSTRMRTVSSAALATVKTRAVTQAVCTSGRARPSTTTAT